MLRGSQETDQLQGIQWRICPATGGSKLLWRPFTPPRWLPRLRVDEVAFVLQYVVDNPAADSPYILPRLCLWQQILSQTKEQEMAYYLIRTRICDLPSNTRIRLWASPRMGQSKAPVTFSKSKTARIAFPARTNASSLPLALYSNNFPTAYIAVHKPSVSSETRLPSRISATNP